MSDPNGPAQAPDEPQAPRFGAPGEGDAPQAAPAPAPAPGEPAQPFSSPAPVPPAPPAFGAPGQQQPPQAPPFGAPGQQQPPQAPPYGAPGQQQQPYGAPQGAPGQQQPPYGAPQGAPGQHGAPQYGAPGQPQYPAGAPMAPQEEKQAAMFGHLGGIAWVVYLGWLGPLIVFLMYKDRSPFVRQESKEALNFQLFMTILTVGGTIVISVLTLITFGLASVLYFLVAVPPILGIVFAIIGAVRVNGGGSYRYPFNWRLIK